MKVSYRLCIFLVVLSIPLFAQRPPEQSVAPSSASGSPSQPTLQRSGSTSLTTLDVVVTNKSGQLQTGLQQQNFTLLDNKSPQSIVSFRAVEESTAAIPPVEIILFIDTVNTGTQTVADETLQITRYLQQNGGKLNLPTSVVIFSDSGLKNLGPPTLDGSVLTKALAGSDVIGLRSMHRASGSNGAAERLTSSLRNLYSIASFEAKKPGRKMLIWISPGWPMFAGPGADMYSEGKEKLFSSLVLISTALQQARVTLYSIDPEGAGGSGLRSRFSYESYLKGIPAAKDMKPANLALQVLVTQTGGRVLTSGNDIGAQINDCTSDTKVYYTIAFDGLPTERPDEYHSLELKVDKPGLVVRTTAGYYAQPEQRSDASERKKK